MSLPRFRFGRLVAWSRRSTRGRNVFFRIAVSDDIRRQSNTNMKSILFALLFGGAFGAVGVFMSAMAINEVWLWADSRTWQSVPAFITRLDLDVNSDDDGTSYRVICDYKYTFRGRLYDGNSPCLYSIADNIGSFHEDLYDRLSLARDAGNVQCFVDPDRPEKSLLDRTFRPGMLAFEMPFMIAFGSIGLVVLSFFLASRKPRETNGRIRIDSDARASRVAAKVMVLYHGLITIIVVPVSLVCLVSGNLYALIPLALASIPVAAVYFSYRYAFVNQPVAGTLLLPDRSARDKSNATLLLPASWSGPVDLETRWMIPAPPSNRVGVEDETGDPDSVQLPSVGGTTGATEIELPMPELPDDVPRDRDIKLEVMGTIGGYQYQDEFAVEPHLLSTEQH